MHQHIFTQPIVSEIKQPTLLTLRLSESVSDLLVLSAMTNPIAEFVVSQVNGTNATLIVRHQPFVELIYHHTQQVVSQYDQIRTLGQGARLYSKMGTAPRVCIEQLRAGVVVDIQADDNVYFSLAPLARFELISLEQDLRILSEPQALVMAKAILGRKFDHSEPSSVLAVHISELEQVRRDLREYLKGESGKIHPGVSTELLKLDHLLQNKHQWLLRTYHQSLERPNFGRSSNEQLCNIEQLQRKLDCFELLAPKDVSDMVKKLSDDEN
ncbi:hypothetical protein K8B83_14615 [Shewanella inventionis]|uniref:Uncharacterized protein n=1 Tax=Shewanella inventionis TaxID=1738770 RepID=A0ABQ1JMA3_9GAMM|nr:hypothetical protein [Shewanella inventionis]MCL1159306.1 hypothetical protein [Shewanella inventionis]UAL42111.1 hypothetical protein K8B83_14615 [Shewanella inventionis]GGB72667.1 hypothetical protein GCM10011607_36400 [Shewanella inventionis]